MEASTPQGPSERFAVMGPRGIHWRDPKDARPGFEHFARPRESSSAPPPGPWFSFPELERRGIRQLWITDFGTDGPAYWKPVLAERLRVCVPGRSAKMSMFDGLAPAELYSELARFEAATGGELFVQSPAVTSDVILRHCHQGKGTRAIDRTVEPAIARRAEGRPPAGAEGDLVWWTEQAHALQGRYVHHFDLNAAYLGAAGQIALPQGEPRYWKSSGEMITTKPKRAGYWLAELPLPGLDGYPPIARNRGMRSVRGEPARAAWVTTPTLELAVSLGPVRVFEGWYWPNTCNALRPWYERLRDARAALVKGPAYAAVKQVYKAGVGRLGSTLRSDSEDRLYQPTWRHMVIAEARGRVWRRLAKAPIPPIAVQVDGAWWLSDEKDPRAVAEWLGLPLDPIALGHWKHTGRGAGSKAVKALAERDPIARLRELTHV